MFNRSLPKLIDRLERLVGSFDNLAEKRADDIADNISHIDRLRSENDELLVEMNRAARIRDRVEEFLDTLSDEDEGE